MTTKSFSRETLLMATAIGFGLVYLAFAGVGVAITGPLGLGAGLMLGAIDEALF